MIINKIKIAAVNDRGDFCFLSEYILADSVFRMDILIAVYENNGIFFHGFSVLIGIIIV